MKEVVVLFLFVVQNFLVSGNPLTAVIPTIQTCPQVCNQNGYQNPNTYQNLNAYQNQNGYNIPVVVQQNPTQVPIVQPNAVPTVIQQPTTNNQLYPQQIALQNQLTAPIMNNQMNNPFANQLNQIYMNKILSNPTIQTLLEQNSNLFQQPGIEYATQANFIPNPVQNPVNTATPTVVNNYFLLPPEFLNKDLDVAHPNRRPIDTKGRRSGPPKDRDTNRRNKEHLDERRPHHDIEHGHPDVQRKRVRNPDCPVHSRRENQRRTEPIAEEIEYKHSMEEKERNHERRKQTGRNYNGERKLPRDHLNHQQRIHPERHNEDIARPHEIPKPHKPETKRPNIIIKIKERPKQSSSENQSPRTNSAEKTSEISNRHKKPARSRDDEIIENFKKKFPAIPEEVVRKLLSYLRRQMHRQQLGHPPFYYPDVRFPLSYDQLFPHALGFDFRNRNERRRRPNRRNPNKKLHRNSHNSGLETTTNIDHLTSTLPTTTENILIVDRSNENSASSDTEIANNDHETTTQKHKLETTTSRAFPELGTEDTVHDVSNGIIDDYYPDFTQDKTYYDSDEVFNVRSLRDNRYHYTTDRNYESRHNHNKKHKNYDVNLEDEIEEVLSKPFDKIESTSSKYEIETEIQFRTPPSLESPDFRTKQIMRHKPNEKNLSYKSSTYSDAKNPSKSDTKNYKVGNNKKNKSDNIQTVYAHSKVVKYGKVDDENEENVTPVVTYYLPDNMQYEEDGKTIVVAKRIPADHFW